MSLFVCLLFCFNQAVLSAIGEWSACNPYPHWTDQGAIASVGSRVYTAYGSPSSYYVQVYDLPADAWTTLLTQPPVSLGEPSMVAIGTTLYLSVESPPSGLFYAYNIDSDGWTTKTATATVASACAATDGTSIYLIGNTARVYTVALDTWVPFTAPPSIGVRSALTHHDGWLYYLYTSGDLYRYAIPADTWSLLSPSSSTPPRAGDIDDALVSACGDLFFLSRQDNNLHKYQFDTDAWANLIGVPSGVDRPLDVALDYAGTSYIFQADQNGAFIYEACITPMEAKVVGDPEFTTFLGSEHHLDLRPGVFNIFTSATLAVNIMVDALPNVPPESDQVVVMVGLIALLSDCVLMVTCAVQQHLQVNVCAGRYVSEDPSFVAPSTPHWTEINHGARIQVGDVVVKVVSSHTHWICPEGDPVCQQQQHLDVYVQANPSTARSAVGLLADLDNLGRSIAQDRLSSGGYETEGGLLALAVPATAGHLRGAEKVTDALLL